VQRLKGVSELSACLCTSNQTFAVEGIAQDLKSSVEVPGRWNNGVQMAWIIGAVIVIGIFWFSVRAGAAAAIFLALLYLFLWFVSGQQSSRVPSTRDLVVSANSSSEQCRSANEPVAVTFTNNADKPLLEISFSLVAREKGHSSILYRAFLRSDRIIQPGESFTGCYGLNPLSFADRTANFQPQKLDWATEVSLTRFESN
jgi:hypothetical protein